MWSWNNWTHEDKVEIERMAFNIPPAQCAKCEGPMPEGYDLDQIECRSCRKQEEPKE